MGWVAIDPIFILRALSIPLADLLTRAALRVNNHLAIHPYQHLMVLDRFFHLGRDRFDIGVHRRLGVEVEDRPQHLLELFDGEIGNVMVENQIDVGAARIVKRPVLIPAARSRHSVVHANLDVLIPFLLLDWPAIDLEVNAISLDQELSNERAVSRLHGRPPQSD